MQNFLQHPGLRKQFLIAFLWLVGMISLTAPVFSQNSDSVPADPLQAQIQYFDGLRQRNLYTLIEVICQRELNQKSLTRENEQFYRIELAQTFGSHAQIVPIEEATEFWKLAYEQLQKIEPQSLLTQTERSLLQSAQAEQSYWIWRGDPFNSTFRDRAVSLLQSASPDLAAAETALRNLLKQSRPLPSPRLSADRAEELSLTLGRANLRLAELFRADVPQRTTYLRDALSRLQPLTRRQLSDQWTMEAELLLMTHARLQNDEGKLKTQLEKLNQQGITNSIRLRAIAEQARAWLENQQPTRVADLIKEAGTEVGFLTPELQGLMIEALWQMKQAVSEKEEADLAKELQAEIDRQLETLQQRGEAYQVWRIRQRMQQSLQKGSFSSRITQLIEQARRAKAQQDWQTAVQHYESALKEANANAEYEGVPDLCAEAAIVFAWRSEFSRYARILKSLWQASPNYPHMEQVHLLWVQFLGREYISGPTRERLDEYRSALDDHIKRYPDRDTFANALWLTGELEFARMQVTAALKYYQQIPADHSRYLPAQLRIGQCYQWVIQRLEYLNQPTKEWQQAAVRYAKDVVARQNIANMTETRQAEVLLQAAQILLNHDPNSDEAVRSLVARLDEVSAQSDQASPAWKLLTQKMKVLEGVLLAKAGETDRALRVLESILPQVDSVETGIQLLRQLNSIPSTDLRNRQLIGEFQLQLVDQLEPLIAEASRQQQTTIRELQATAARQAGRLSKAVEIYQQLVAQYPNNKTYVTQLSQWLADCQNAPCREKVYQLWKSQSKRYKQGSEEWLNARYELAVACTTTNRMDEARKIVQLTQLLYPNKGSEELQQKYAELGRRLK